MTKAQAALVKKCRVWNEVLERVRLLDVPNLEETFGCAPINTGKLDKDVTSLITSMGSEFAQLDDRIPLHLLQYPLPKP